MHGCVAALAVTGSLACAQSRDSAEVETDGLDDAGVWGPSGGPTAPGDEMRFDIGVRFDVGPRQWDEPVTLADRVPRPTSGGTMTLSHDGGRIFAADEDRDLLYVVDTDARTLELTVELEDGCAPGRVVEGYDGLLHVVCRGTAELVSLDGDVGEIIETARPCANPRGLAVDPETGARIVACAEGLLVTLQPDGHVDAHDLGVELRDVVEVGPLLRVSTFRPPKVLTLTAKGELVEALDPQPQWDPWSVGVSPRTVAIESDWGMLHQFFFHDADEGGHVPRGEWDYGAVPTHAITMWKEGDEDPQTFVMHNFPVAFDVAISPGGEIAAAVGYTRGGGAVVLERLPLETTVVPSCDPNEWVPLELEPVSIAFDADGMIWVQSREPGGFAIVDPEAREVVDWIDLNADSVLDTGYMLFNRPTEAVVACATCHPEGREDGARWSLTEEEDRRRTMSLAVGLGDGAPFHWPGDMEDIGEIADEVFVEVMSGPALPAAAKLALERFLFAIPSMHPRGDLDPDAVARGKELFEAVGCAECHVGPRLTNDLTVDLGPHGKLQVPSLLGVAYRAPYMHDSRAPTLEHAVTDMLLYSQPGGDLTLPQRDAIATYLRAQ